MPSPRLPKYNRDEVYMKKRFLVVLAAVFALVLNSCARPPEDQVQQANSALQGAESEGASQYAPEAWNRAKQASENLSKELQLQSSRFSLFRNFRKAGTLAEEARGAADRAGTEAVQKKAALRDDIAKAITELGSLLQSVRNKLTSVVGTPGLNAAALRSRLDSAGRGLDQARSELDSEGFENAATAAEAARGEITAVLRMIDQAVQPASKKR